MHSWQLVACTRFAQRHAWDLPPASSLRFVEYLRDAPYSDPFTELLMTAPEDAELLAPEEEAAVNQALQEARTGQTIPWEEVRSQNQFHRGTCNSFSASSAPLR